MKKKIDSYNVYDSMFAHDITKILISMKTRKPPFLSAPTKKKEKRMSNYIICKKIQKISNFAYFFKKKI